MARQIHTSGNRNDGYKNTISSKQIGKNFGTQKEAIDAGRKMAINKELEHIIHRPDGRIREANSYGNDPCPPKDSK